jgi:hypothetical protein
MPELRAEDLQPRTALRVDPSQITPAPPDGSVVVEILDDPADSGPAPAPGQIHLREVIDPRGHFPYPAQIEEILARRGVPKGARILLTGEPYAQGLIWVALVGNGFDAALVVAPGDGPTPSGPP